MYKIIFEKKARKQFFKLNREVQERITRAIDEKLTVSPKAYLIRLVGDKSGLYKFRVGDYRLLCFKEEDRLTILMVKVKHRQDIYKKP